jgi:glutaredoxin
LGRRRQALFIDSPRFSLRGASPFEFRANIRHFINVKPKHIRLFIKPYCGWCQKAMRWLDERQVQYERIDVMADENAFDEMIRLSGQDLAPVLEVEGEILADFGPEQLPRFFEKLEKKNAPIQPR